MERALALGRKGWGRVHPNPMVGCVVAKDGEVIGEGYHEEFGAPHAEANVLTQVGREGLGSDLYVSLEPCRHVGKTPACTDAIVRAGVRRVVFGARDITAGAGGGADELREAGIEVVGPLLTPERAREENPAFFHNALRTTPYLALKLATSLDGRIAVERDSHDRLSGSEAEESVHALRAGFDAVLIGSGTALTDDPRLTVRHNVPFRKQPARIILDSQLRLTPDRALFDDVATAPVVVFTGPDASEDSISRLESAGATVHPVSVGVDGVGLDFSEVLGVCVEVGVSSILCEGGATLAKALADADAVERFYLFITPHLIGEGGLHAFGGRGVHPGGPGTGVGFGTGRRWSRVGPPRAMEDDVLVIYDRVRSWSHGGEDLIWQPLTSGGA